ncbi:alpha/beta family hydrolase [Arvimicrobium flavum]|uniref:alpha/beta hydrolase family protein n=1 Tax=Arvimicrobium flavum TaxID=3393320 RepID=UPI00237AC819|nr:alpha/beta family hydrolase [Mesorhizobium shangrilense]
MGVTFLIDGEENAPVTILLGHGAGAPMDSASMNAAALALASAGLRVARFEFAYMAGRRTAAGRKPPPRAETLIPEYRAAVVDLRASGPLVIGGKSMGGRVASMLADDLYASHDIVGLLCLGYPFHPPGKPQQLRTNHLEHIRTPTLIVQGTRDEFGTREEVETYALSPAITLLWLEDGDHDLKPRQKVSGYSAADHLRTLSTEASAWIRSLPGGTG